MSPGYGFKWDMDDPYSYTLMHNLSQIRDILSGTLNVEKNSLDNTFKYDEEIDKEIEKFKKMLDYEIYNKKLIWTLAVSLYIKDTMFSGNSNLNLNHKNLKNKVETLIPQLTQIIRFDETFDKSYEIITKQFYN